MKINSITLTKRIQIMTYINTRGWLRRMGARIGGQVGLTGGGANERAGGPPTLYVKKTPCGKQIICYDGLTDRRHCEEALLCRTVYKTYLE